VTLTRFSNVAKTVEGKNTQKRKKSHFCMGKWVFWGTKTENSPGSTSLFAYSVISTAGPTSQMILYRVRVRCTITGQLYGTSHIPIWLIWHRPKAGGGGNRQDPAESLTATPPGTAVRQARTGPTGSLKAADGRQTDTPLAPLPLRFSNPSGRLGSLSRVVDRP